MIVEREAPGGQAGMSAAIENYLGFPRGLSGSDLAHRAITPGHSIRGRDGSCAARRPVREPRAGACCPIRRFREIESRALVVATGMSAP